MRFLCIFLLSGVASAASTDYRVSFDNAVHHEARITVRLDLVDADTVTFLMSQSSPGRYAEHNFAKNVYDVSAVNGDGVVLPVRRASPYAWEVSGHDGSISLSYTLYGDLVDGTYTAIDLSHAHLNMPATFMWAKGYGDRPISITFEPGAEDWKIATQLVPTDDPYRFTAPDLYYFLDSPVELSDFVERSWSVGEEGNPQTIRLIVHHTGNSDDVDELERMTRAVVNAQTKIFGELPRFDYGVYSFICDFLPWADNDGMEHRNSTIVTESESLLEGEFKAHLGTISHEFIHVWNAERLRPRDLEPFDFEKANQSRNLWFAEGFTSYYGPLAIRRAGEMSLDDYLDGLAEALSFVINAPGRHYRSPVQMSEMAPFRDAATSVDPTNFDNTFVSYYGYGAIIGLALDLTLRIEYDVTLDDYIQSLWQEFGRVEHPYALRDLEVALARLTGSAEFARGFFSRYVESSELPDFAGLLANAGITMKSGKADKAWLGSARLRFDGPEAIISSPTRVGSPLYDAGLDRGDRIVSVGRFSVRSKKQWEKLPGRFAPGDVAVIRFIQRGKEREAELVFAADPSIRLSADELEDRKGDRQKQTFRDAWLGAD